MGARRNLVWRAPMPYTTMNQTETNRVMLQYVLWNLLTIGFYGIFFADRLARDLNLACCEDRKRTTGILLYAIFSPLTLGIYSVVWWALAANRLKTYAARYSLPCSTGSRRFLFWSLPGAFLFGAGPFIALHQFMQSANTVCSHYNENQAQE